MNVREQLLESAARVYAEAGYRGATTRRIAEGAGVNEITLFRHFGSKDALIREAVAWAEHPAVAMPLPDDPSEPERELLAWSRHQISNLRARRSLIRTCMGEAGEHPGVFPCGGSGPAQAAKALVRYLRSLRAAGLARAPFDESTASAMLMGSLFADAMGRDIMPEMYDNEPEAALLSYVRLFLRAIGVEARTGSATT